MPRPENPEARGSLRFPIIRGTFPEPPPLYIPLESAADAVVQGERIAAARELPAIASPFYLGMFALAEKRLAELLEHEKPIKEGKRGKRDLIWSSRRLIPVTDPSIVYPEVVDLTDRFGIQVATVNHGGQLGERVDEVRGFSLLTTAPPHHYEGRYSVDISATNGTIDAVDCVLYKADRVEELTASLEPYRNMENLLGSLNNDYRGDRTMSFVLGDPPEFHLLSVISRRLPNTFRFGEIRGLNAGRSGADSVAYVFNQEAGVFTYQPKRGVRTPERQKTDIDPKNVAAALSNVLALVPQEDVPPVIDAA